MAITVDYSTAAPWLITVPQSDLTLITGTQYQLTVDEFWILLRDFTDNENVMAKPVLYSRIPATSSTPSITEIDLNYYQIEFEDGLYSVNIIDGNTNIREAEVKNQVSVNTNNTTGFINPTFLEYSTFGGGVTVDVVNGESGTAYPVGTPARPVDNMTDALSIAGSRGFNTLLIRGDVTVNGGLSYTDYVFTGQGQNLSEITINGSANVLNTTFQSAMISGTLDGDSHIQDCIIDSLSFVTGVIERCLLNPITITLSGTETAHFINCESGVPGTSTPTIDMGGSGRSMAMRNYNGGIRITNKSGTESVSIDLGSGQVRLTSSVTNGTIIVRGVGKLVDDATGDVILSGTWNGATIVNETLSAKAVWDEVL